MGIYQFKNLHTGMTPSQNPNAKFRVAKFRSKCHSIEYYIICLTLKILIFLLGMKDCYSLKLELMM
jgi:hypothetical protein